MRTSQLVSLRHARRWGLAAWLVLFLLVAACTGQAPPSADPAESFCDGISADFGGCAPDRPTFRGNSCAELATEWGHEVDHRVIGLIDGPATVDGKAKSVRNTDALVLTSLLLTQRLDALGLRASCNLDEFWPIAQEQFSEPLRAGAGSLMWDADPVVPFDDWLARAKEIVGMIDDQVPGGSIPGASAAPSDHWARRLAAPSSAFA